MSCAGHALDNDVDEGMDDMPPLDTDSEDEGSAADSDDDDVVANLYRILAGSLRDRQVAAEEMLELETSLREQWSGLDEFPDPPTFTKEDALAQKDGIPFLILEGLDPGDLRHIFTDSEMKLCNLALKNAWSADELKDLMQLLKDPTFRADDISPGLHQKFQDLIKVIVLSLL